MSMINYASREINCKIVYYGSGLGGKTTNLEHIYGKVQPDTRGKLISLATETERTLFFDFLPVDLGTIRGFKTRFHLYTVPGQVYYNASRKLILKGVDGIVFVADSQVERMEANQEAMQNLYDNMAEYGYDLTKMPLVIQYNKRDLPNAAPVRELQAALNPGGSARSRTGSGSPPTRITPGRIWSNSSQPANGSSARRILKQSPSRATACSRPCAPSASSCSSRSPSRSPHDVNLPNAFTAGRIAITPLVAWLPFAPTSALRLTAFVLFIVAAVSDYIDGHLARSRQQETDLGRLLDPL